MATGSWNTQNSTCLSTFLDSLEKNPLAKTVQDDQLSSNDLFKLKSSTNPFRTPSVFDDNVKDSFSFFESIMDERQGMSSEGPVELANQNTNPFLEPYSASDVESNSSVDITNNFKNCSGLKTINIESYSDMKTIDNPSSSFNVVDVFQNSSKSYKEFVDNSLDTDNECQIKNYFDCRNWVVGEVITLRVSNIYHPHRFWIVPRYRELEIFMEYLSDFYLKNRESLRQKQVAVNLYCAVSLNNLFYRAIVVGFLPNDPHRVKVFSFDYGSILIVFKDEVYLLPEKFYGVPQFAVRASLAYVCPRDRSTWSPDTVKKFDNFSANKILIGQITAIDKQMKVLELNIGETPLGGCDVVYINEVLIDDEDAKYIFDKKDTDKKGRLKSQLKYLYLHPTFHMIESGKVPSSVYQFEALQNTQAFNVLYNQYFSV